MEMGKSLAHTKLEHTKLENTRFSDSFDDNPYKLITRRIDAMKIRNSQKKEIDVSVSSAEDLNYVKEKPVRAGAIIYTYENNQTYFCLGIDTQSGNLTDFGGGVKKGETIIEGALRELEEESEGVFGNITASDIPEAVSVHCYNMAIVFIPMELDRDRVVKQFRKRVLENTSPEVCNVIWLTRDELLESIHGRGKKLYNRVQRLLSKATATISEL